MPTHSIVYLTDNSLPDDLATLCRRVLLRAAGDMPVVCVSQQPVEFGDRRIVVGDIGRSWLSLYRQLLAGLEAVETPWVAVAEHDVLYDHSALSYLPDDAGVFWYNANHYLLQIGGSLHPELDGSFSYWPGRIALSQLVCSTALLREAIGERVTLIESGVRELARVAIASPGGIDARAAALGRKATNGGAAYLSPFLEEHLAKYSYKRFRSAVPTVDIRHAGCFTGPRRGKYRRTSLEPWGTWEDILSG